MARPEQQRRSGRARGGAGSRRTTTRGRSTGPATPKDLLEVLASVAREIDRAVQRPPTRASLRTKFQVAALLIREERAAVNADATLTPAQREQAIKRLDGLATILAKVAVRDTSLLILLAEDTRVSSTAREYKENLLAKAGREASDEPVAREASAPKADTSKQVMPQSALSRQLANPFLAPDFTAARERAQARPRRLAGWELLDPLFHAFERDAPGARACMELPDGDTLPAPLRAPGGRALMPHQEQLVAAAAAGHRTFLLADEPGLGKTAQALMAAEAADAYPLLVVAPNVVKMNWAREVSLWTPHRTATVVHGDGDEVDAFADVIIVNYAVLDRHVGWFADHGFRGMVVDEAHFIKNKTSQRSQHVLGLADRIRKRTPRPLLMALTGTPLINDVDDFRAIWEFLGWIDADKPLGSLINALEETGLIPTDRGFYAAARAAVVSQGIVRRRKVDVAADIPARRVADLAVELDGPEGRSIRAAETALAARMVEQYRRALAARPESTGTHTDLTDGIDLDLARRIAAAELKDSSDKKLGENVFSMVRRIGQAKASLAADYTAQLVHHAGKVVFFAKHIDVMDEAQQVFTERGIRFVTLRGDQSAKAREASIKAFTEDPEVSVIVCSLMSAGVGVNLQVASNLVLAELSWTDAEQTQAIDRIHRIGQSEPVTAWRILAAQTIDSRIAELIDSKSGLAARALDGAAEDEVTSQVDVQMEALVGLLVDALQADEATTLSHF
ncbi:DEAD/DEAH box helicase [Demequina sp. NBRC 110055]|uniref:DEAD/DEAH box helicase n=1 Tax=Demequina sp. NBRC 110055 TaxID=1570344 RepID=UPI0009FC6465|nr:DEAD/DEAH box helicase [Demequina sp. NBRC 110055]